jgi:hypothetical protein
MTIRIAIVAAAVLAAGVLAPRLQADERRTPTQADIVRALAGESRLANASLVGLSCTHRPSHLFGDDVFRCHADLVHESGASERVMRVLAAHEQGWAVAAR